LCLLLGVIALGAPARLRAKLDLPFLRSGLRLSTTKPAYWRYEMVEFQIDTLGGGISPAEDPLLEVEVYKDGARSRGIPGRESCLLRWDANVQAWRGRWPIPWNPDLGEYEGRLVAPARGLNGEEHSFFTGPGLSRSVRVQPGRYLADCSFNIRGRKPYEVPKGFSVVTLEPGSIGYRFPGPDGGYRGANKVFDWMQMMEADAFWHCGIQTQVWGGVGDDSLPWSKNHLDMVWEYAEEARRRGVAYGPYMLTFLVGGDFQKTDYDFTLSYERSTDRLKPIRFISMADPRRQRDITAILKRLAATPGVSYIGMDYVRANTGGLEFTDEFLADLDLDVPEALRTATVERRRRWLGHQLAIDQDKRLQHQWDWWRAHRVSLVLKGILDEAKVPQPIWVFSLGWKQGHQHGQDPRMLIDAGISFNSPMFYEADQEQYPVMLGDWQHYLGHTGGSLVLGQVVDTPLLHPRKGLNGPEEYLQRHLDSLEQLGPVTDHLGFFWHDLNRAVAGGRSGHGSREWALAGATAASRLREAAGVVPVRLDISVAGAAPQISGRISIRSLSRRPLDRVRVDPVWTPGIGDITPRRWWVKDLQPGELRTLTFSTQVTERFVRERYRGRTAEERMLAFRARAWQSPEWPRSDFAFSYWKAASATAQAAPAAPSAQAIAAAEAAAARAEAR
jgi:hypothetical protein